MSNLLETILKTIQTVENKNKKSKTEETADPAVFDLLRKKVGELSEKQESGTLQKGKRKPKSILDLVLDTVNGAKKENKKDPNVPTAPKSVFDQILNKVEQKQTKVASTGLKKIVEDYNLDVGKLPQEVLQQIQAQYQKDVAEVNQKYAQGLHDLIKKVK